MPVQLQTFSLLGLDSRPVAIEVDYRRSNQPSFTIVGLPDKSVQESRERVIAAIRNSGFEFKCRRLTVNLAPADLPKSGPIYDLPIALGYLLVTGQIDFDPKGKLFAGELALDGSLRPVSSLLPLVSAAVTNGSYEQFIPAENADEASLIADALVFPCKTLNEVISNLHDSNRVAYRNHNLQAGTIEEDYIDINQIHGQMHAKRALEIAAAGGHNLLLVGSPGSGKTLLARAFQGLLPPMSQAEAIEVTKIYSVAGMLNASMPLITNRPFRTPHHTSSHISIVGGGSIPKPGEVTLAHRGVLFLDELPEYPAKTIEVLRQPLVDKEVTISRAASVVRFPASFALIAAMNPCKCGYLFDDEVKCECSTFEVKKYQKKISGPILDRIDIQVRVNRVKNNELLNPTTGDNTAQVKSRIEKARKIQIERYHEIGVATNAELKQKYLEHYLYLPMETKKYLIGAADRYKLTARGYFSIIKIARTIADLAGESNIEKNHIAEALSYRGQTSS